jgi:hypothetical protein
LILFDEDDDDDDLMTSVALFFVFFFDNLMISMHLFFGDVLHFFMSSDFSGGKWELFLVLVLWTVMGVQVVPKELRIVCDSFVIDPSPIVDF